MSPPPETVAALIGGDPALAARSALESLSAAPASRADLARNAWAVAAALQERGVRPGDRVALVSPNDPALVSAFLGATSAGSCAPLNPAYGRAEFDFFLQDLAPRHLLVHQTLDTPARAVAAERGIGIIELGHAADAVSGTITFDGQLLPDAEPAVPAPDAVALMLHTSGTTSRPKMVPLTHRNLAHSARQIAATLALGPDDRSLVLMPLFHIHGLVAAVLAPLSAGGAVIVPPGFLAPDVAGWLARFRPTWYTAVPTMHQAILQRVATPEGAALRRQAPLRFIRSSSAALAPRLLRDLESVLGVPVIEAYGMTEAAHQMTSNPLPPASRKPGSVGRAAGPEVAIMDAAGSLLPRGELGEVVIRGPNVTPGYLANPEANAAAFADGWFRTGDQGFLDGDGYLTLTGRLKELINRAGEKIAPLEVDAVLVEHPAVAQAITFAMPHAILGEDVAAAVTLKPGAEMAAEELRRFAATRLAYFKVPRQIRILERLPVGPTGKLQRRGLAEQLGVVADIPVIAGDTTPPRTPVEEIVASVWCDVLQLPGVGIHENFFALGGDSMLATRVVVRLRELLQVDLPLLGFFDTPSVAGLAAVLAQLLGPEDVDG